MKLAAKYGLTQTATLLQLDYYALKRRLDQEAADSGSNPGFVELPSTSLSLVSQCVIEWEDGRGASLRVHLQGTEVPDVLALGRSFWNAE
ncbi:MAG: hypothetical protein GTO62_02020 [Planctomycetales bacterium]|nr:hypothetical protein [Planctomycetales bacterium]NIM56374.1 hypothetical protein [Stutzerimonas stutzeri]